MAGKLYVVSTPIGNLEDITLRALRILKEVNVIAAEDTRHTRQLLNHFDIHVKLISFHAYNEHDKINSLMESIESGQNIALVSDAGTPSVADPGFLAVREAMQRNIPIEVIPGVSALTFAVTASGLPVDKFQFRNFAPVKQGKRQTFLESIKNAGMTVFFFESPFRVEKTLKAIEEVIGPEAKVAIIREATKMYEEIISGTASQLAAMKRDWKGEFVIGVHANAEDEKDNDEQ